MRRRAVFLDVDGTLVNDRGVVPDSAREAVQRARANGHLVFLCTGRSTSELWDEILDVGFDGVIAAAGGYVEHGGRVLVHHHVPVEHVMRMVDFFQTNGIDYFLESNEGLFGSRNIKARLRHLFFSGVSDEDVLAELQRGLAGFIDSIIVGGEPERAHINKACFMGSEVSLEEIRAEFGDVFDVIPSTVAMFGSSSGELSLAGVHKASGIQILIEHLGIDRADTMAYGDGFNDLEMLDFVAIGVAMGNAHQDVRARADDVTGTVDDGGLHASFTRYGLI